MNPRIHITFLISLGVLAIFSAQLLGQDVWVGNSATTSNWTDTANWQSGMAPQNGDPLLFQGSNRTTNTNDLPTADLDSIAFGPTAAAFVLQGKTMGLLANGITNNSVNLQTINFTQANANLPGYSGLVLYDPSTTWTAAAGPLSILCNVEAGRVNVTGPSTLTITGAFDTSINGAMTDDPTIAANTLVVVKTGSGILTLSGNNTYTGGTTLNAGTLLVSSNTALGTGTFTINGGTFGATDTVTLANNIVANADFNFFLHNPSFQVTLTLNGTLDLGGGAPRTITLANNDGDVTFNGQIFNATGLTLSGNGGGQFTLGGSVNNTYTGTTTFSNILVILHKPAGFTAIPGDLILDNATALFNNNNANPIGGTTITATNALLEADTGVSLPQNIFINDRLGFTGADSTLSGAISGPGVFRVVTFASVTLTNNASSYSGGTSLENGTLFADANNALGTGPIDVQAGQINNVVLSSHVDGITLPNAIFMEADLDIAPAASGTENMTLNGNVDLNAATRTITNTVHNSLVILNGVISNGALTLDSDQAGFAAFEFAGANANTYTGLTTVQNVALILDKSVSNGSIIGDLVVNANGVIIMRANEQIADTSTVTLNGNGGIILAGFNERIGALFGDGNILLNDGGGGPGGTLTVGSGDFTGVIHDDLQNGNLVKDTTGTLRLSGTNTYVGTTNINAGGLQVDGSITSNTFVNPGGTLLGVGTIFASVVNSGVVNPGDSPGTLTINNNYTQNANGTLRIEVAGLGAAEHDLLAVNGTAALNGTLQVLALNNFVPQRGDRVTFLTDGVSHSGVFSNVISSLDGLLQPVPQYDELNDVYLLFLLGSFNIEGLTPNQQAVARELDRVANDPRATDLVNFLSMVPLGELPHDYDLIAPEELASIYEIGFSQAVVTNMNLQHRMDDIRAGSTGFCASGYQAQETGGYSKDSDGKVAIDKNPTPAFVPTPENRWGFFVTGSGDFVNVGDHDSNAHGYDITTGNVIVGADYRVCDHFAIGIDGG